MDDNQENYLSMLQKVLLFLTEHSTMLLEVPSIATDQGTLNTIVQAWLDDASEGSADLTGHTLNKKTLRADLHKVIFKISRGLTSWASDNNDFKMRNKFDFTDSDWNEMRDNDFYIAAKRSFETANTAPMDTNLAAYRITATDLTNAGVLLGSYYSAIPEPKEKIGERSAANKMLEVHEEAARKLLEEKLDGKIDLFKSDHLEEWEEYQAARGIDDTGSSGSGSGSQQFTGTVPANDQNKVADITYNASTPVVIEVTSGLSLHFVLTPAGGGPATGAGLTVNNGETKSTTLGDLGPSGAELWAQNTDPASPADFDVTIG